MKKFNVGDRIKHIKKGVTGTVKRTGSGSVFTIKRDPEYVEPIPGSKRKVIFEWVSAKPDDWVLI